MPGPGPLGQPGEGFGKRKEEKKNQPGWLCFKTDVSDGLVLV